MKKTQKMEDLTAGIILDEYESLYRMAYTYVRNESDAMDIVQESAYKAITKCQTVKPRYLKTWIYRITINTAIDLIRKNKKEVIGIEDYEYGAEDSYQDFAGRIKCIESQGKAGHRPPFLRGHEAC